MSNRTVMFHTELENLASEEARWAIENWGEYKNLHEAFVMAVPDEKRCTHVCLLIVSYRYLRLFIQQVFSFYAIRLHRARVLILYRITASIPQSTSPSFPPVWYCRLYPGLPAVLLPVPSLL